MREELKNFNWHFYGLSIQEFDYTYDLIFEILQARKLQLESKIRNTEITDESGSQIKNDCNEASEAIDDIKYYHIVDNFNLFHFGLWRLQGVFEGLLKQEFLPDVNINGLKKRLDQVRSIGFEITDMDYEEIIEWGKLRNALSHFPPEKFGAAILNNNDLLFYKDLVKRVAEDLLKQKNKV